MVAELLPCHATCILFQYSNPTTTDHFRLALARSISSTSANPAGNPLLYDKVARVSNSGSVPGCITYSGEYGSVCVSLSR